MPRSEARLFAHPFEEFLGRDRSALVRSVFTLALQDGNKAVRDTPSPLGRIALTNRSLITLLVLGLATSTLAGDWTRFRGPNGSGISPVHSLFLSRGAPQRI